MVLQKSNSLPHRTLGRTRQEVSILGLGGGGLLMKSDDRDKCVQLVNLAIDLGIDYLDTAPGYGPSEEHLGEVIKDRRQEVFLATKIHPRSRDDGWQTIERSLKRLQTDHIDLIQVHDIQTKEEVDAVIGSNGSLKAILEARSQGLVKWIGVTGHHDPAPMAYALELFDFDTVLMPINITDKHYLSYIDNVLPTARERNLGIIAMKVYCAGGVFSEMNITPRDALLYSLSQSVSLAIVGADSIEQLEENIEIARNFQPLTNEEQEALLECARDKAEVCNSKFKREPV